MLNQRLHWKVCGTVYEIYKVVSFQNEKRKYLIITVSMMIVITVMALMVLLTIIIIIIIVIIIIMTIITDIVKSKLNSKQ
jgi:hypothetical protein